ncbi:MAG: hypothetical protein AAGN66_20805 [Acidobacteriota bacterium]
MGKHLLSTLLLAAVFVSAESPAVAQGPFYGYTFNAPLTDVTAAVGPVSTSQVIVPGPSASIVQAVADANAQAGPVIVGITGLLFDPTTVTGIDCRHYERGTANMSKRDYRLRGDFRTRVDTFFQTNASIFKGSRKVNLLAIHPEVNNQCVENWKITTVANYVRAKLDEVAEYGPIYLAGAYGFGSFNGLGRGFPVVSRGVGANAIDKFPSGLDAIAFWAYDVFNPNQANHPLNIGSDPWPSVQSKLNQALRPNQVLVGVLKGFCAPQPPQGMNTEAVWGVNCPQANSVLPDGQPNPNDHPPFTSIWKIGAAASNWSTYLLTDPRAIGVLMFNWRSSSNPGDYFWGTGSLPQLWSTHAAIAAQWEPQP